MRIKNKSWSPLVVSLPGGGTLNLAGRGTKEISAEDFESPEVQRLAKTRTIIVLPEGKQKPDDAGREESAGQEASAGKESARPASPPAEEDTAEGPE
jgi:hypothetical protein